MPNRKIKETEVIKAKPTLDVTVQLASYLEVLGSSPRLAILKLLQKEPMDIEKISHRLWVEYHKTSTRENTKNHVDKLLSLGLVTRKPGMRDNRAVINYVMVPGSIETAMRTLSKFMKFNVDLQLIDQAAKVQNEISEQFSETFAKIRVLGGTDDGTEFVLKESSVNIGRSDPESKDKIDLEKDIVLSEDYTAVTRVWKPHARLLLEDGQWFIEHCEGRNETRLWEKILAKNKKEPLSDGDIIRLAEGPHGARLVYLAKAQGKTNSLEK